MEGRAESGHKALALDQFRSTLWLFMFQDLSRLFSMPKQMSSTTRSKEQRRWCHLATCFFAARLDWLASHSLLKDNSQWALIRQQSFPHISASTNLKQSGSRGQSRIKEVTHAGNYTNTFRKSHQYPCTRVELTSLSHGAGGRFQRKANASSPKQTQCASKKTPCRTASQNNAVICSSPEDCIFLPTITAAEHWLQFGFAT